MREGRRSSGLTLLEMMVAVSLLVVIVLGLTMMFLQTQKAFKIGLRQVDIFENGRAAMEIIRRDLEQTCDAGQGLNVCNLKIEYSGYKPLVQMENGKTFRSNQIWSVYALQKSGSQWITSGYVVTNLDTNTVSCVGTLYRYTYTTNSALIQLTNNYLLNLFENSSPAKSDNFTRVADGVVHFTIRAYYSNTRYLYDEISFPFVQNGETNNLPDMLDVELGILDPETYEQVRLMPAAVQANFLASRAGKVHIFRQQIPISTVSR